MIRDLYNKLKDVFVINEVVTSGGGAVNVTDIDLRGFDGVLIMVSAGASGDTLSGTDFYTVDVQDSEDGVTYADVTDIDLVGVSGVTNGQVITIDDPAEDEAVYRVGYVGNKRYLDITITPNGTLTNGTPITVTVLKGYAHCEPV